MFDCLRLEAPTPQESSFLLPNPYSNDPKRTLQQKILLALKMKSLFQIIMAILILLFPHLISALTFYPIFFQPNAMIAKVSRLNLPSNFPPPAQITLANNHSLKAQCSFLSPPQTNNHLPTTTKVSGQDWRQQMPILCSRTWSSTGTPILNPESGLCSLPGAASKFPMLFSIQLTCFIHHRLELI